MKTADSSGWNNWLMLTQIISIQVVNKTTTSQQALAIYFEKVNQSLREKFISVKKYIKLINLEFVMIQPRIVIQTGISHIHETEMR